MNSNLTRPYQKTISSLLGTLTNLLFAGILFLVFRQLAVGKYNFVYVPNALLGLAYLILAWVHSKKAE